MAMFGEKMQQLCVDNLQKKRTLCNVHEVKICFTNLMVPIVKIIYVIGYNKLIMAINTFFIEFIYQYEIF